MNTLNFYIHTTYNMCSLSFRLVVSICLRLRFPPLLCLNKVEVIFDSILKVSLMMLSLMMLS